MHWEGYGLRRILKFDDVANDRVCVGSTNRLELSKIRIGKQFDPVLHQKFHPHIRHPCYHI